MNILFEDQNFLAVDKLAGVLTVPARLPDDKRVVLGRELEKKLGSPLFPVHRLDADVSGLVLFAKNAKSHQAANIAFEKRLVQKIYQGFSNGAYFQKGLSGTWKEKILRGKKRAYASPAGKLAITEFEVVDHFQDDFYEWRLHPLTGRSHQLRWEMFRHESPLVGDTLYGSTLQSKQSGIALRSISLNFSDEFKQQWKLPVILAPMWLKSDIIESN